MSLLSGAADSKMLKFGKRVKQIFLKRTLKNSPLAGVTKHKSEWSVGLTSGHSCRLFVKDFEFVQRRRGAQIQIEI